MIGSRQYGKLVGRFKEALEVLRSKVLAGEVTIDANTGPEIWVVNESFSIPTSLWSAVNRQPLAINLNAASVFHLATFPRLSLNTAKAVIRERDKRGYFTSLEEARQCGFEV